jgi:protein phosphatase
MGTTLVMALPIAHEMYITHIGDSRAYWITRHGCYQVTLDDDVASREVRLGYAIYREALQHSGSGSLIQALGMSKSASLHPTSQRFIIDEDAVFLLTSDGLSDFDRVEELWETEILPILGGNTNIEDVAARLIEIANTKNGHDNVTIALVHYQVKYCEPDIILKADIPTISASKTVDLTPRTTNATTLGNEYQQTQVITETKPGRITKVPLQLLIILGVLLGAGGLGYWLKIQREPQSTITPSTPSATPQPTTSLYKSLPEPE